MGVARIGTFYTRRNVIFSCSHKKHRPVNVKQRWRGKDVCKVDNRSFYRKNLKYVMARVSLCLQKWTLTLDVHICANVVLSNEVCV